MTLTIYERVTAYHVIHGDDVGSEESRQARYSAILSLIPHKSDRTRRFKARVPRMDYTGIDLLEGANVMDETRRFDVVIANGLIYKLPDEHEAMRLLDHCWKLATEAFIFTSLDSWEHYHAEELTLDPADVLQWARKRANGVVVDCSYKPGDFAVGMFR